MTIHDDLLDAGVKSVRRLTPTFVRHFYRQKGTCPTHSASFGIEEHGIPSSVEALREKLPAVPFPPPRYPVGRFPSLESSCIGLTETIAVLKFCLSDIGPFSSKGDGTQANCHHSS